MAEKKNFDEEYQYVEEPDGDLNQPAEDNPSNNKTEDSAKEYSDKINSIIQQPNVRRNAIIAVLGLFILIGILKCTSKGDIPHQQDKPKPEAMLSPLSNNKNLIPSNIETNTNMTQLLESQKSISANVSGLNEQVSQLNAQINVLVQSNQALQQQMQDLANKMQMEQQSIQEIIAASKSQSVISHKKHHYAVPHVRYNTRKIVYFVQAVVPGRAWLVSEQGNTMSVRIGSKVPSYGVVKSIDALQGRIMTSSGRVIVFNQAD